MDILIRLVFAASMAVWVYLVAQKREKYPLGWAAFAFLVMPFPLTILGIRHRRWIMLAVGLLTLIAAFTAGLFLLSVFHMGDGNLMGMFPAGYLHAFLLLVAMTLIARKRIDRFAIGIHLYVALQIGFFLAWPFIFTAVRDNLPAAQFGMVINAIGLAFTILCLAILWAAWALSDHDLRPRCFKTILYFTIAFVACAIIARITIPALIQFLWYHQTGSGQYIPLTVRSIEKVIHSLPLVILLIGAWREHNPAASAPGHP